jgi:hypothetical protein
VPAAHVHHDRWAIELDDPADGGVLHGRQAGHRLVEDREAVSRSAEFMAGFAAWAKTESDALLYEIVRHA